MGSRITDMTSQATGEPIDPEQNYVVAGWASVNEGTEGPPIWDVWRPISGTGTVTLEPNNSRRRRGRRVRRDRAHNVHVSNKWI
jgi:sulfur-oxidizing protein SoxB